MVLACRKRTVIPSNRKSKPGFFQIVPFSANKANYDESYISKILSVLTNYSAPKPHRNRKMTAATCRPFQLGFSIIYHVMFSREFFFIHLEIIHSDTCHYLRWLEIVFIFPRLVLQILFQVQFGLSYQCEIYHSNK